MSHTAARPAPEPRSAYHLFRRIDTRWADNDAYGHVNNVVYYAWFDTAVNAYLIEQGVLDIHDGATLVWSWKRIAITFRPLSFRSLSKWAFALPVWAAQVCAMSWACLQPMQMVNLKFALPKVTSFTSMSINKRAVRCHCL